MGMAHGTSARTGYKCYQCDGYHETPIPASTVKMMCSRENDLRLSPSTQLSYRNEMAKHGFGGFVNVTESIQRQVCRVKFFY